MRIGIWEVSHICHTPFLRTNRRRPTRPCCSGSTPDAPLRSHPILTDFEKAELWASKRIYPSARIHPSAQIQGCNYHNTQLVPASGPFIPFTDIMAAWTDLKAGSGAVAKPLPSPSPTLALELLRSHTEGDPRTNNEIEQKLLLLWQGVDPGHPKRPRWRSREDTTKELVATYNAAEKMGTIRAVGLKFKPLWIFRICAVRIYVINTCVIILCVNVLYIRGQGE